MSKIKITLSEYDRKIHRFGRITTIILILALLCVPLSMSLIWHISIDTTSTATAIMGILVMFILIGIVEFFSYAPILGPGGTYISFNTGNILNMKLPAAISSVEIAGFEPGSKDAELVSMIAIAVSSIVTTLIIFIGMLFVSALLPILESTVLKPAFDNFMPAILGALGIPILLKDIKTAWLPCLIAAIATIVLGYSTVGGLVSLLMPVFLVIAVLAKFVQYKKSIKTTEKQ